MTPEEKKAWRKANYPPEQFYARYPEEDNRIGGGTWQPTTTPPPDDGELVYTPTLEELDGTSEPPDDAPGCDPCEQGLNSVTYSEGE